MMNENKDHICGTCKWQFNDDGEWICNNPSSEFCVDYTDYEDSCYEWEGGNENTDGLILARKQKRNVPIMDTFPVSDTLIYSVKKNHHCRT